MLDLGDLGLGYDRGLGLLLGGLLDFGALQLMTFLIIILTHFLLWTLILNIHNRTLFLNFNLCLRLLITMVQKVLDTVQLFLFVLGQDPSRVCFCLVLRHSLYLLQLRLKVRFLDPEILNGVFVRDFQCLVFRVQSVEVLVKLKILVLKLGNLVDLL